MPYLLTANPGSPQSWVKMETESVRSGNSDFGQQPRAIHGQPHQLATPTQGRGRTHHFAHASLTHHPSGSATLGHSAGAKYANYANANVGVSTAQQLPQPQQQHMPHHPTVPNFVSLINGSSQQQLNNSSSTNNSSSQQQHNSSSTPPMMSPTSVLSNYSLSAANGLRHNYNGSPLMGNANG